MSPLTFDNDNDSDCASSQLSGSWTLRDMQKEMTKELDKLRNERPHGAARPTIFEGESEIAAHHLRPAILCARVNMFLALGMGSFVVILVATCNLKKGVCKKRECVQLRRLVARVDARCQSALSASEPVLGVGADA